MTVSMVTLLPCYADWLLSTCPVVQLNLRIVTARSGEESIICEHVPLALFTHIHFVCVCFSKSFLLLSVLVLQFSDHFNQLLVSFVSCELLQSLELFIVGVQQCGLLCCAYVCVFMCCVHVYVCVHVCLCVYMCVHV